MADIKISALPGASTLTGTETIPLVQGGTTKKATVSSVWTMVNPSYTGTLTGGTGVVNLGSGQFVKDASGSLGLGVTPNASTIPSIQSAYGISIGNNEAHQTKNAYYNSNWKYVTTTSAARFTVGEGGNDFRWYNAPSGTAGNPISFTQAMTLDASGNLGVGTASPSAKLDVASDDATTALRVTTASNQNYQLRIGYRSASLTGEIQAIHVGNAYSDLMLQRDGGNVLVGASGSLLVGTTSAVEKLTLTGRAFLADQAAPATPTGGGVIYVEAGALKYKGSSGTVTILAAA